VADVPGTAEEVDEGARNSATLEWAVRIGLVAYGFVHLLVCWVALRLVFGESSGQATGQGALAQLAGEPLGALTLAALALGFVALAIWQAITGAVGYRDREGWSRHLRRLGALSRVLVFLYFAGASARLAAQGDDASGGSPDSVTAQVMAAPAGLFLVAGAGLLAIAAGVAMAVTGVRKRFLDQLDEEARTAQRRTLIVFLGQVGYTAKGLAFVIIGLLLCWAAYTHDPEKSGGLDQALLTLLGGGLGRPAVIVVAAGLGCFGLYLFARSRHLDDESLTS